MKKIIMLNGLPRSGKDTLADYLVEYKGYIKLSFADALKNIIARTFNISRETLDDYKNSPNDFKIKVGDIETDFREILQRFGSEGMKPEFGNNIWADIIFQKIEKSPYNKFVISDFRFLIEHPDYNDSDVNVISLLVKDERDLPTDGHSSDVELYQNNFKFDYIIENLGTLDDYYCNIENLDFI